MQCDCESIKGGSGDGWVALGLSFEFTKISGCRPYPGPSSQRMVVRSVLDKAPQGTSRAAKLLCCSDWNTSHQQWMWRTG